MLTIVLLGYKFTSVHVHLYPSNTVVIMALPHFQLPTTACRNRDKRPRVYHVISGTGCPLHISCIFKLLKNSRIVKLLKTSCVVKLLKASCIVKLLKTSCVVKLLKASRIVKIIEDFMHSQIIEDFMHSQTIEDFMHSQTIEDFLFPQKCLVGISSLHQLKFNFFGTAANTAKAREPRQD